MMRTGEVEFNYTWYQMTRAEAVVQMAARVPALFSVRAQAPGNARELPKIPGG